MASEPIVSWVNLGEVYSITARELGHAAALETLDALRATLRSVTVNRDRALAAARIKADYPMSYADAFAVATAIEHDTVLLTGDPEIIGAGGDWAVGDLRQ